MFMYTYAFLCLGCARIHWATFLASDDQDAACKIGAITPGLATRISKVRVAPSQWAFGIDDAIISDVDNG